MFGSTPDVLITTDGPLGRVRLNRPKALHALTREMCETMSAALLEWRTDPAIKAVLIDHAEGRGFCAGGDVVMLARSGAGDGSEAAAFFSAEYRLNHLLFTYPKPTIAIMDGITMGGGVGISLPCTFRVATENTRLAMPETGIGLFPDVGGGWYLSRLPGRVGQFMALTGARLDGAECHYLRLATHYVEQAQLPDLVERLAKSPARASGACGAFAANVPAAKIESNLPAIAKLFASDHLEDVLAALDVEDTPWADRLRRRDAGRICARVPGGADPRFRGRRPCPSDRQGPGAQLEPGRARSGAGRGGGPAVHALAAGRGMDPFPSSLRNA
jgi:enoyl-CoA hydratase